MAWSRVRPAITEKPSRTRRTRRAFARPSACPGRWIARSYDGMIALGADVRVSEFDGYDDTEEWARGMAANGGPHVHIAVRRLRGHGRQRRDRGHRSYGGRAERARFILPVGGGGLARGIRVRGKASHARRDHRRLPAASRRRRLREVARCGPRHHQAPAVETMAGGVEGGIGALDVRRAWAVGRSRRAGLRR